MPASSYHVALLAALVLALSPSISRAQGAPGLPGSPLPDNYNFQLFEPFDLDLNNVPVRTRAGFFFRYDKTYWAPSSERVTIGTPGATTPGEIFVPITEVDIVNPVGAPNGPDGIPGTADDLLSFPAFEGTPPGQLTIINSIQDAPPQSEFGFGERYEFGYTDERGISLEVGILDGPTSTSEQLFGFVAPGVATVNGFGSVFVNFTSSDPNVPITDILLGFRDFGNGVGELGIPITNGPDGIGNGIIDNIDGDADAGGNPVSGAFGIDLDVDGVIDFFLTDFEDLTNFNIRFNDLTVRNVLETQGIEIMKTFTLDNRNRFRRKQHNEVVFGYGVRLMRIKDDFFVGGDVDLFGQTDADVDVDNQIIGPQVRAKWVQRRGAVTFDIDTRFQAGLNIQDVGLVGNIGGDALPGGLNNSATLTPTTTAIGFAEESFSPLVELRANVAYQISQSLAVRAGYTFLYVDGISRSSQLIGYTLPNYTLLGAGEQDLFYHGLNFGLEGRF